MRTESNFIGFGYLLKTLRLKRITPITENPDNP